MLFVLAVLLQYTNKHNFSVLRHLINLGLQETPLLHDIQQPHSLKRALETLFMLFEAQPYLLKVWNCSGLLSPQIGDLIKE